VEKFSVNQRVLGSSPRGGAKALTKVSAFFMRRRLGEISTCLLREAGSFVFVILLIVAYRFSNQKCLSLNYGFVTTGNLPFLYRVKGQSFTQ
jgi:hypothetical protein